MSPIFITPEKALEKRMSMLKQLNLSALSERQCEYIHLHLALFEAYRNLPLGLNPSTRQQFKKELKESQSVTSLGQLTKKLRNRAQRYRWNRRLFYWLSKNDTWSSQSDWLRFKRAHWESVSPYAYYASEDLRFLSERVLPAIDIYLKAALKEVSRASTKKNAAYYEHLNAFRHYLQTVEAQVKKERHQLAQAMLVRLELMAANRNAHDDVMFYVSEHLSRQGVDWRQTPLGARPYQTALAGLNGTDFHYFHHFIMAQGNEQQKKRCQALPWVAAKEYVYHKKSRQWRPDARLIPGVKIPTSRLRPNWLFRARNARYDAFHDFTRFLTVRFASQSAQTLSGLLQRRPTQTHEKKDYQQLHHHFVKIQQESERIGRIRAGLTPFIHARSRRELKQYRYGLYQKAEQVVLAQLSLVQKAQKVITTLIDENDKLDNLFTLADQLSEATSFFPKGYKVSTAPTRPSALTLQELISHECRALKNQIAKQKIQHFVLALQQKTFEKEVVYDQHRRPIYRRSHLESVERYFNTFKRYLNPDQQVALLRIQCVMQGRFVKNGNVMTYAALREAATQLVENPDDILTPLFQRFILSSIVATDTSGYQLLLDYEQHHADTPRQRSTVLRAVKVEEKISLHAALKRLFESSPDLTHLTRVKMSDRIVSLEDFVMRLRQLEPEAIDTIVAPYLENYRGEDEHLWPVFSVLSARDAMAYAHQRLAALLRKKDYDRLASSDCLCILQSHLVATRSVQKTLLSFLQTVKLKDDKISNIDALVSRFGDAQQKMLWVQRREHYLLSRLNRMLLHPSEVNETQALQTYLETHPDWLTSKSAKQSLVKVLSTLRLKGWTDAQHALVSTISETTLRQIYLTRLLKRILSDRTFAEHHIKHLPTENDTLARYALMNAPDFRSVCEKAIQRLRSQTHIDHLDAIRVLESLFTDGLAVVLEYEDLSQEMEQLLIQFKEQLQVDVLAKETISLMDLGDRVSARDKIQRLRETYDYYQSVHQDKESEKVKQALIKIVDAIEERYKLSIIDKKKLLPDEAQRLVDIMPAIEGVESLRWRCQHHDALSTIVIDFQNDVLAVGAGKESTLASLPLFFEALQRGVIVLSAKEQQAILLGLRAAKEGSHFSSLPRPAQHVLSALLRHFQGGTEALNAKVLNTSQPKRLIKQSTSRNRSHPVKPKHTLRITATVHAEVSRQIIEDMQTSETMERSLELMRNVLTHKDEGVRNQVVQDLFYYFREAYQISVGQGEPEEALRIHARIQLKRFQYLVNKSELNSNHLLAVLARRCENMAHHLLAFTLSLKAIVEKRQRELPELNQLAALCVKLEMIDAELREQWVSYLTQVVLPHIDQNPSAVSMQLAAVLPSFLRLLEGKDSVEDRQRIVDYEAYYRDRVQASVKRSSGVRLSQLPGSTSSPHSTADRSQKSSVKPFVFRV